MIMAILLNLMFLKKAFMQKVNPTTTFTQFIYNYVYNTMASGNGFVHFLRTGKYISYANVLNSDFVMLDYNGMDGGKLISKDYNIKNYNIYIYNKNIFYYYLNKIRRNSVKKLLKETLSLNLYIEKMEMYK